MTTPTVTETAVNAEKALLGCMMLSPAAMWQAFDLITPADFYDPKHELLFQVIEQIGRSRREADTVAVVDELLKRGATGRVPVDYVNRLTSAPSTSRMVAQYAEIVRRHAMSRRAVHAAEHILAGVSDGADVVTVTDEARAMLDATTETTGDIRTLGEDFDTLVTELGKPPVYRPTPWPLLNEYIDGLMPGCVYVVAARPGQGKTMVGLQLAWEMTRHGPVSFHSYEMTRLQLLQRLMSGESEVPLTSLRRHTLSQDDWHAVAPVRRRIVDAPLFVDERPGPFTQLVSRAHRVARKGTLAALVVDYLQLIPAADPRKARWEHVGELTRGFKILAKDMGCPVVLLCQLNRESERNMRLPTLADLRESGSIEQDADVVLMLQRRREDGEPTDVLDVVVAKNRHGQQGRVELAWDARFGRVVSPRWQGEDFRSLAAGDA